MSKSIDWKAVDWTQPTRMLAKALGVSTRSVTYHRIRIAPHTIVRRNQLGPDTDWTQTNKELAAEYGISSASVQVNRLLYSPSTCLFSDWGTVDWTRTDTAIAATVGASIATVGRYRKKYDPSPPRERRGRKCKFSDWVSVDWTLTDTAIAANVDASIPTVAKYRQKYDDSPPRERRERGEQRGRRRADWSSVDWTLTDEQIAAQLGRTVGTVYIRRCQHDPYQPAEYRQPRLVRLRAAREQRILNQLSPS